MRNFSNQAIYTAILPIKFNSERVSGKNFRDFLGSPLYLHILRSMLDVQSIKRIVINTDAPKNFFDSEVNDSKVDFSIRPKDLIGETVSMNSIIDYEIMRTGESKFFMTHATNPLLTSETISKMLELFSSTTFKNDSIVSISKYFGRFLDVNGFPMNHNSDSLVRTQDLEPVYFENSCGYVFSQKSFSTSKSRIGKNPLFFETPKLESIDIDDEEDWVIAEALAKHRGNNV